MIKIFREICESAVKTTHKFALISNLLFMKGMVIFGKKEKTI
ncbi:hypothetical protein FEM08_31350 [Flavobacterium gilvum]|nr:hypothetical protein FEM08_31350 [Flavobacterium gilvum]